MNWKKPIRKSLARQVLESMETWIREGCWPVGERIPSEPELARAFSVSHNTIREALQSLIHAGILEAKPGDGTYVIADDRFVVAMNDKLREAEIPQILEARRALEKEIARLAAENRTLDDLAELERRWKICCRKTGQGIEDDMEFHAAVAAATRNSVLIELYRVIVDYLRANLEPLLAERQYAPEAMDLHANLLTAIQERNANAAEAIVVKIVDFDVACLEAAQQQGFSVNKP